MMLVSFMLVEGGRTWINPDHVVEVRPFGDRASFVHLGGDHIVTVEGDELTVVSRLAEDYV